MRFELQQIEFSYTHSERKTLNCVNAVFDNGCFHGIFGPNGSGKSTLLKIITGELQPDKGRCLPQFTPTNRAKMLSLVEQEVPRRIPLTVREIVTLGRYPWQRHPENHAHVEAALEELSLLAFAERSYDQLSGGEKQRVMLARAVAQNTKILLLDEPTSALDLKYQLDLYYFLQKLAQQGKCVIMVSQNLFLAPQFLDNIILLKKGEVASNGKPAEVLTKETVKQVFECTVPIEKIF